MTISIGNLMFNNQIEKDIKEVYYLNTAGDAELKQRDLSIVPNIEYEHGPLVLGYSFIPLKWTLISHNPKIIKSHDNTIYAHVVSVMWNKLDYRLTAEAIYSDRDMQGAKAYSRSVGWYVMADYWPSPDIRLYSAFTQYYSISDRGGANVAKAGLDRQDVLGRDISVGTQYRLNNNWSTKFEYHHFDGQVWLSDTINPTRVPKWNMIGVSLIYEF